MTPPSDTRRGTAGLGLLFGAIYFAQGIGDPTEGLVAQPVRSLLKSWGRSDSQVTDFAAALAIPWSLKPLFGLLTDSVPLFGSRRRSYLILTSALTFLSLLLAYIVPIGPGGEAALLLLLVIPTAAIAFADVVADALMIEVGRPRGIVGTLQSAQWGCLYAATIVTGIVGGLLSQYGRERFGFLLCAGTAAFSLVLAIAFVRDVPETRDRVTAWKALMLAARTPGIWAVGGFLFLWNFNPFSQAVLHLHMEQGLGLNETFYGRTVSILAASCVAASLAYGVFGRKAAIRPMIHASIALGMIATAAYWLMIGPRTAVAVTIAVGLTYMTATLIQLELAARSCPPEAAGTAFALLMSLENLASAGSTWVGGRFYGWGTGLWGRTTAFQALVGVGVLTTAACWLFVPSLPETGPPRRPEDG